MQSIKRWLRYTLDFSHAQTTGFLILLPLILLITFSNPIYRALRPTPNLNNQTDFKKLDSLIAHWENKKDSLPTSGSQVLFTFNPNHVSKHELLKLGFPITVANRLLSYRSKGGTFKKASDVLKVYGLDTAFYARLMPYIHLPVPQQTSDNLPQQHKTYSITTKKELAIFDINKADTTQLKTINGIGSKLALRVVRYRSSLGGFTSPQQLHEIWGLDSTVVTRLINVSFVDPHFKPTPLYINTATEKELSTHPYLSKSIARVLVTYRFQHGKFASVTDLEKVQTLDMKTIQKIAPYLNFE